MKNMRTALIILLISLFFSFPADQTQARFDDGNLGNRPGRVNPNFQNSPRIQSAQNNSLAAVPGCHFGITVLKSVNDYDLSGLGVGQYLDWGHQRDNSVAANIDYYEVLNVSDAKYEAELQALNADLDSHTKMGATWIIGNEPDSEVNYQDHVSAETYSERFFAMATQIRSKDRSAKIAFGTIIQPTPVRLHYLTNAINRLTALAGSRAAALALIDIYSIHAFILNEEPLYDTHGNVISWGAGVPVGYNTAGWPAVQKVSVGQTYDINVFKERITAFRQWMYDLHEQSKPLWITEYGSLIPTYLVSELDTATYMEKTFDFMLSKYQSLGQAADEGRLVQKWLWYSLNEQTDKFGGSLYDPRNKNLTTVGQHFINYDPAPGLVTSVDSDAYVQTAPPLIGPSPQGAGYYQIRIGLGNLISSDRLTAVRVDLSLAGKQVGTVTIKLPRCAGTASASFHLNGLTPGNAYVFTAQVTVVSGNGPDNNPDNNQVTYLPITMPTFLKVNLPIIQK